MPNHLSRCLLLISALANLTAVHAAPGVIDGGPRAMQRDVRQVSMRFSDEMVALGDSRAPDPATVRCSDPALQAVGHWIDTRNWVGEFPASLADGVACTVSPKPASSLKGETVAMPKPWTFNTGGPQAQIEAFRSPRHRQAAVMEEPVVIFRPSVPVDAASLAHLKCLVRSRNTPVRILAGAQRDAVISRWRALNNLQEAPDSWIVAQCGFDPWPNDAIVTWKWGMNISSAHGVKSMAAVEHRLLVRSAFDYQVVCTQLAEGAGCDPRATVALDFSETVARAKAGDVVLLGSSGKRYAMKPDRCAVADSCNQFVSAAPFVEGETLTPVLDSALTDVSGRTLARTARTPLPIAVAHLPSYVGMLEQRGVMAWKPGQQALWALALRNTEKSIPVRSWRVGSAPDRIEALLALHRLAASDGLRTDDARAQAAAFAVGSSLLGRVGADQSTAIDQTLTPSGPDMEFVGIPLSGYGSWLIEADNPRYRARTPKHFNPARMALVQLTNLRIHARLSDSHPSLIWLTAIDTGNPVPNAEVEVRDCTGTRLFSAKSDALGRVMIDQALPAPVCRNNLRELWIVARQADDICILHETGPAGRDTKAGLLGHTILDRVLLRAGETVSMQTLVRLPVASGYAIPPSLHGKLKIFHNYQELVHEQDLDWDGRGSALYEWRIPASAKLGRYTLTVSDSDGRTLSHGSFQVEELRMPAFEAHLRGATAWQGGQQGMTLSAQLRFMAGGVAAGQPIVIKGAYSHFAAPPVDSQYQFGDVEAALDKLPDFAPIQASLDSEGKHAASLPAPAASGPLSLLAEMEFADANGETQVQALRLPVWPQRQKVGLRVRAGVTPDSAEFSVLVLDEDNRPVSGRAVDIDAAQAPRSSTTYKLLPVDEATRFAVCTVHTDSEGKGECSVPWTRKTPDQWLFRARAAAASTGSMTKHQSYFSWSRPKSAVELAGKQAPAAGQPAKLRLRAPFLPATVLLTVEREGVLSSQVHTLTAEQQEIELATEQHFAPAVNVAARFVRGAGQALADVEKSTQLLRSETLGLVFDRATHRLDVSVNLAQRTARPGQTVRAGVAVRQAGRPAAGATVTLIAVDDALLALSPNPTWSLLNQFWRQRYLPMHTADVALTWRRTVELGKAPGYWPPDERRGRRMLAESMLSPPQPAPVAEQVVVTAARATQASALNHRADIGDAIVAEDGGAYSGGAAPPRSNFSSLALWKADVVLDQNGEASVAIPLPDSLTRWRIVALAIDAADRYGLGTAFLQTRKNLQILSGLPQTVRSDDVVRQKVTIRNDSDRPVSVRVRAQAQTARHAGLADLVVKGLHMQRSVTLAARQNKAVDWDVTVPDGVTGLDWKIDARVAGSDDADALEVSQRVVTVPLTVRESSIVQLDQPRTIGIAQPPGALPGMGGVAVQWRASLAEAALAGARTWMAAYPYRCMEQLSSMAVVSADGAQWEQAMAQLPKYLDASGLVQYFPNTRGSENLTAYLLDIASATQRAVPTPEKARMRAALQAALGREDQNDWLPDEDKLSHRLALQAALAPDLGTARPTIPADLNALPTIALLDWVRYVLTTGDTPLRRIRLDAAADNLRKRFDLQGTRLVWRGAHLNSHWWMMWSQDVVSARTALLVQQWAGLDPRWKEDLARLMLALVDRQQQGRWDTTVSNAWSVAALQRFERDSERGPVSGVSRAAFGGQSVERPWPQPEQVVLPWSKPGQRGTLELRHAGSGAPWATVQVMAAMKGATPVAHGVSVTRTVSPVQQRVAGQWSEGDIMKVTLALQAHANASWLVINDPIPSGATILGKGLGGESALAQAAGADKSSWWSQPSYVERAGDSYRAYYQRVSASHSWSTSYLVRLNNAGTFSFPSTRVEAMYAPEIFAESPNLALEVRP